MHNLFWLHRGRWSNFTWQGGAVGYVNVRGPAKNLVRIRHDLDHGDPDSHTFNIGGVFLEPGHVYHVAYRYQPTIDSMNVVIDEAGTIVAQGHDTTTTDLVRNDDHGFFIYFANDTDVSAPGPEVPSIGWSFADLHIAFVR